jgi:pimeloyl-ACP methyl ester carboxylesterase
LVLVLDALNIQRVVCLGEGSGANIAARFAIKNPNRCSGVVLIHPTGSSASFMEQFKEKVINKFPNFEKFLAGKITEKYKDLSVFNSFNEVINIDEENIIDGKIDININQSEYFMKLSFVKYIVIVILLIILIVI